MACVWRLRDQRSGVHALIALLALLLLGVVYAVDAAVTRSAPPRASQSQPLVPTFSHPVGITGMVSVWR